MTETRQCHKDKCPTENQLHPKECFICSNLFHLPCYDLVQRPDKIFVIQNVVFVCDSCLNERQASPKRKQTDVNATTTIQSTLTPSSGKISISKSMPSLSVTPGKPTTNQQLASAFSTLSKKMLNSEEIMVAVKLLSEKVDNNAKLLNSIDTNVKTVLSSDVQQTKSYSAQQKSSAAQSTSDIVNIDDFPPISRHVKKQNSRSIETNKEAQPKSYAQAAADKQALRSRVLIAGTNESTGHSLGNAVVRQQRVVKPKRVFLPKAVYVSRLEPTVTVDDMCDYIRDKIPDIDENQYQVRLLVKKDQDVDELTFVSFRLSCSDALYAGFRSSTFWPGHVMIGDFVDKPSKRSKLGEFLPKNAEVSNESEVNSHGDVSNVSTEPKNLPEQPAESNSVTSDSKTNDSISQMDLTG